MSFVAPGQTLAVQYDVESVDGTTPSRPFSRDAGSPLYVQPNAQGIYQVAQNEVGLIDPDLGTGGSLGDRFVPWIDVLVRSPATVRISIVDGEDPSEVFEVVEAGAPAAPGTPFSRGDVFRCQQGALIKVETMPPTAGASVRVRIQNECVDCPPSRGPNGPTGPAAPSYSEVFGVSSLAGVGANPRYLWPGSGRTIAQGDIVGLYVPRSGFLRDFVLAQQGPTAAFEADLEYEVLLNGGPVAQIAVASNDASVQTLSSLAVAVTQGDQVALSVTRSADHSTIQNVLASLYFDDA